MAENVSYLESPDDIVIWYETGFYGSDINGGERLIDNSYCYECSSASNSAPIG